MNPPSSDLTAGQRDRDLLLSLLGAQSARHTVRSDELGLRHRVGRWCWVSQAARPAGADHTLMSCIVSPGFDFADCTID
ncbi:cupin domain-containing protein [Nocardia sp. NPDC049707]|uniref:cupin domain-containing protein n=1 Tax=Nocardia sp. NPDC049707 TaxID=3154735 RepID=UPI00341D11C9